MDRERKVYFNVYRDPSTGKLKPGERIYDERWVADAAAQKGRPRVGCQCIVLKEGQYDA